MTISVERGVVGAGSCRRPLHILRPNKLLFFWCLEIFVFITNFIIFQIAHLYFLRRRRLKIRRGEDIRIFDFELFLNRYNWR